jgi:Zn-dependent peptidase ImmA (M78 family)
MKRLSVHISILSILCLFSLLSCDKDESIDPIDTDLKEYFDRFKLEGEKRGMIVDFEAAGIEGHILDIFDPDVVGKCLKYSDGSRTVMIEEFSWYRYSELEKEFLLFHELGHCFLDRGHEDSSDQDGFCTSIMHSSDQACTNNYNTNTRDVYLDELFR